MLQNLIIVEGDTNIALFHCAACGESFRANLEAVTCADGNPICLPCIKSANPKRRLLGLPEIPVIESAYFAETDG